MKYRFRVSKLSCEHCVQRLRKHLKTFDPEAEVSVDLASRTVEVDGAAERKDYAYVISDAGFDPL
jgi:copper chaperone